MTYREEISSKINVRKIHDYEMRDNLLYHGYGWDKWWIKGSFFIIMNNTFFFNNIKTICKEIN